MDKLYLMIATTYLFTIIGITQEVDISHSKINKETPAIEKCLRQYFKACDLSDPVELGTAFYPGAMMFWIDKNEQMNFLTQPQWKNMLKNNKELNTAKKRDILLMDHTNDICIAKVISEYHDKICYSYMAIVKATGEWRIVCQVQNCTMLTDKQLIQKSESDIKEIEGMIQIKLKSMDSNDPDLLSSVYHPRTMSYYIDNSELVGVSIGEWIARFDFNKRTHTAIPNAERKIETIDCVGCLLLIILLF